MRKLTSCIFIVIFISGCATKQKSIITGALIGASGGLILGNQHKNDNAKIIGAAVGAGLGALIGYRAYKDKNKIKKDQLDKDLEGFSKFAPLLKKPKVKMYWVPHQIKGTKFIERHRVWEIQMPSTWSR